MNTHYLAAIGIQEIQKASNLKDICTVAVKTAQRLWQCEHVAIFQMFENHRAELRAEIGTGELSRLLSTQSQQPQQQDSQGGQLSHILGNLLTSYRTFPIFAIASSQPQADVWGYLFLHQSSIKRPMYWDIQALIQQLLFQVEVAIQQIDLGNQQKSIMCKQQDVERYKLSILRSIAHEYRTPLTKILAAASTLERHSTRLDTVTQKRLLVLLQEQVRYLSTITNQVLDDAEAQECSDAIKF